jgi:hypothetical protein
MATQKAQTMGFLPGDDPEAVEANRRYQEALNKLTQSLDTRKNRMFDPVWLAAAQGFLAPGTPDFFESLGRVAKNVGEAQTAQAKENRDIAQMELDVAGRGLEMQRQRSLQSMAMRQMQGQQAGEPSGAPQGGQRGFQIAPPDPNRMTGQQYYALAIARGIPPDEAMKGASQIDERNKRATESGLVDLVSGFFYPNKFEAVDYQIFGKTYKIPQGAAMELDFLARSGDEEAFNKAARSAIRDFQRPPPAAAQQGAPVAPQPAAAPSGQPTARPAAPKPVALQAGAPQAAASQAAAQPSLPAAPVVQPPIAAPVVAPVTPPTSAAPAQAANLVGGMFSPPTKNADDIEGIRQAVEYYKVNADLGDGKILNQGRPFAPEVIQRGREQAAQTIERLNQRYGMRPVQAAAARPEAPAQVAPPTAPTAAQPAPAAAAIAPTQTTLRSQEDIAAEKRRSELQQAADTKRAEELAKAAAAKEAALEANDRAARNTYQSASKILDYVKKSPNFFGIFSRPGVVSAIGGFIEQGLRTPTGTIDLPGFRESITKMMPNVRQQDLDNVMLAAAELAEIELNFSRLYFQGQGAVTENERKIVRAIPGSVSNSPRVLKARMELLRDRAQYDIDVADAFRDWQGNNVGRSYLDFERDSQLYKDIKKDFDNKAAKIYNGLPAIPTRERPASPNRPARTPANIDRANDTLENLLKQGRP